MAPHRELRWILLIPPVMVGALVMVMGQAPTARWAGHLVTLLLAAAFHFLLLRLPQRTFRFGLILPSACLLLVALTLAAPGFKGVHRWVSVGPLPIHVSALLAPVVLVACAMAAKARPVPATLLLVGAQVLHVLQPDAGQATAFGIAALLVLGRTRQGHAAMVAIVLLATVCGAWVRPDSLGPVPFVEDIMQRAFALGTPAGVLAVLTLVLYATSPLWARRGPTAGADLRPMLSAYFGLTALVTIFGEFPVPLVGYGPSPLIGAFLGLAMLARAEQSLATE